MLNMQAFHDRLFAPAATRDNYFGWLARLTQARLERFVALQNDLAWGNWG